MTAHGDLIVDAMIDDRQKLLIDLHRRVDRVVSQTRKLIEVFRQNLAVYKGALATTRSMKGRLAQSRSAIQQHGSQPSARRLHLLVSARIDEHRLPDTVSRTARVSGFGGPCEACGGYLPSTQLVMAIPHTDTFVYLHAQCYVIWKAQCHLRAALRRIP